MALCRTVALVGIGAMLGFGAGTALPHAGVFLAGSPAVPEELIREAAEADKAVAAAEVDLKQSSIPPLAKSLLAARLEVIRSKSALLHQRITAIRTWTKQEVTIASTQPNTERVAAVEREIENAASRKNAQIKESEKWAGGLVKAVAEASVATSQLSLAMLEAERIKAKYGIAWMPALTTALTEGPLAAKASSAPPLARTALVARISNKRFVARDFDKKILEDSIQTDFEWDTSGLPRPTRAVKGTVVFADLFGEEKLVLNLTINNPLTPGQAFEQKNRSFTVNQFNEAHRWVKETDLSNMSVVFVAEEIIYQDGEKETLRPSK